MGWQGGKNVGNGLGKNMIYDNKSKYIIFYNKDRTGLDWTGVG